MSKLSVDVDSTDRVLIHLDRDYQHPIRDSLWKHIYLSDAHVRLLELRSVQQLTRIKQLGPSYLVYPGATHTRLSHSLGVYDIARRIIRAISVQDSCPPLTVEGVKAFLTAALLHDLGHFPYAHSLKELPLMEHEVLAGHMLSSGELRERISDDVGTDPDLVAAIIDESLPTSGRSEINLFRRILSGTLDPDKLDYLNRDAYFCGVPYGFQDIDYAVSNLVPLPDYRIAVKQQGVSSVESVLFSKYLMYRAVYWHKTVRCATAMIKKALFRGLQDEAIGTEELYGLDDELFFSLLPPRRHPSFVLLEAVANRRLHKMCYEVPFDLTDPDHQRLTDLNERIALEGEIARSIGITGGISVAPEDVIIDIPEDVSFEISMPIVHDDSVVDYPDSTTVFTPQVIRDFTMTLRRLRVFVSPWLTPHLPADFDPLRRHTMQFDA